jgi:hypothetical protein
MSYTNRHYRPLLVSNRQTFGVFQSALENTIVELAENAVEKFGSADRYVFIYQILIVIN